MFKEETVIDFINSSIGKKTTFRDLVRGLGIRIENNRDFSFFLNDLVAKATLIKDIDDCYQIPKLLGIYEGILEVNPKGFGFVKIGEKEQSESIYIPKSNINTAFHGDEVVVKLFENNKNGEAFNFGFVSQIINRNTKTLVGKMTQNGSFLDFVPINEIYKSKYRFLEKVSLVVDDVVKVMLEKFEKGFVYIKLIRVIGKYNDAFIDIETEIESANVPHEFSHESIAEANQIPQTIDNDPSIALREDLRNELIYTIDGDDTKDFDDAINVKKLDNGNYLLGVHIADVTHYVAENSPLDDEAARRGTSIYLADRVIPMLPESLSNGICSLNPHVDRFTLSMEAEINSDGENVNVRVFPSIINSYQRLTYQQVNRFFAEEINFDPKLAESLTLARELAQILRKYKNKEGYIDFEIEESKIILDDQGKTLAIKATERGESEVLIEDFMVRANEIVSEYMTAKNFPFIYRVHEKPLLERLENLQAILKILDVDVTIPLSADPKDFAKAIAKVKKIKFDDFIKILLLRTMQKAIYSADNIGHFGLASRYYSHFTSPIRRYPDLLAHRMIRDLIFNQKLDKVPHFRAILPLLAKSNSESEQKAVELERKVADIKKAEFYETKIGQIFKGQIMSILKFGFFVEFDDKVDVLVRKQYLGGGNFEISQDGFSLTNGQRKFKIGDKVSVMIMEINKNQGRIDAILENDLEWYKKAKLQEELQQSRFKNRRTSQR